MTPAVLPGRHRWRRRCTRSDRHRGWSDRHAGWSDRHGGWSRQHWRGGRGRERWRRRRRSSRGRRRWRWRTWARRRRRARREGRRRAPARIRRHRRTARRWERRDVRDALGGWLDHDRSRGHVRRRWRAGRGREEAASGRRWRRTARRRRGWCERGGRSRQGGRNRRPGRRGRRGGWSVGHDRWVALDLLDELVPLSAVGPPEELEPDAVHAVVVTVPHHRRVRLEGLRRPVGELHLDAHQLAHSRPILRLDEQPAIADVARRRGDRLLPHRQDDWNLRAEPGLTTIARGHRRVERCLGPSTLTSRRARRRTHELSIDPPTCRACAEQRKIHHRWKRAPTIHCRNPALGSSNPSFAAQSATHPPKPPSGTQAAWPRTRTPDTDSQEGTR